ncbi:MAG TPA: DUF1499 domain-containing protein [bacterium]|nr:DUF1499 domain-containing protein [bacterium]
MRGRVGALRPRWLVAGAALLLLGGIAIMVARYPVINDISTDRADAPRYLVVPPRNPAYDADRLRGPTERAYPDLTNLETPRPPAGVFAAVESLVQAMGWQVAARSEGGAGGAGGATALAPWRLQAVAVTSLLRFKDDVLIEVRPRTDGGSTVAMRSKSRVGKGDLGANAKRIRAFLAALRQRLGGG